MIPYKKPTTISEHSAQNPITMEKSLTFSQKKKSNILDPPPFDQTKDPNITTNNNPSNSDSHRERFMKIIKQDYLNEHNSSPKSKLLFVKALTHKMENHNLKQKPTSMRPFFEIFWS